MYWAMYIPTLNSFCSKGGFGQQIIQAVVIVHLRPEYPAQKGILIELHKSHRENKAVELASHMAVIKFMRQNFSV